jgi:sugar phosphate permease
LAKNNDAVASLPEESLLDPIAASTQRKAAWRLLPIISIGYGLAYMDRINISFASLRMNADLHFSAFRAEALAGSHHADMGLARHRDDVRAHAA